MKPLGRSDPASVGTYRLLGVLGDGGMGRVYLGRSAAGRRVAIKVIRADLAEDPVFRRRFAREVAAMRAVSPLFTAPLVDADTDADPPWLATTYIEAPSLREWVAANGPLAPGPVLVLAAGLGEALASIHRAGLVHRDLKPSNVLLDDAGPRIIDFGIAVVPGMTSYLTTSLVGTPSYLAPELIDGDEASPASDVFARGATLFFASTGKSLAGEGSMFQQMIHIATGRYNLHEVPRPVRPVIVRCLGRRPKDRPTPDELARILVSSGIPAPGPGWYGEAAGRAVPAVPVRLPGRYLPRRQVLALGGMALAAVVGGAVAATLSRSGQRRRPSAAPAPGTVLWLARSGVAPPGPPGNPGLGVSIFADPDARLVTASGSRVKAVDSHGRQRWSRDLPGDLVAQRPWGDAVLVAGHQTAWLLDAATGSPRFATDVGAGAAQLQIRGMVTVDDRAFLDLGTVTVTLDRQGHEVWRRTRPTPPDGKLPAMSPLAASPAWLVIQDVVGTTAQVSLSDAGTGGPRWSTRYAVPPAKAPPSPPPDGRPPDGQGPPPSGGPPPPDPQTQRSEARIGRTWVALRDGRDFRVVRLSDGGTVWQGSSGSPVTAIELAGDLLLVASVDQITAYAMGTGRQVWQAPGREAQIAVSTDGSTVVAASEDGVSAFDPAGGVRWQVGLPDGLLNLDVDRISLQGRVAYVTFRPEHGEQGPPAADVMAIVVA
jgi:outer membrane protein assembly factor BamB